MPFLVGWTSINPSYFDVNYRGTRFWHTAILHPNHASSVVSYLVVSPFGFRRYSEAKSIQSDDVVDGGSSSWWGEEKTNVVNPKKTTISIWFIPVYTKHGHIGDGLCLGLPVKKHLRRFDHWYDAASSHLAFSFMWRSWLVVWNMFFFSISYMGCHPSHWRTPSFFRGVGCPHQPARLISSFKATHLAKWDDLTRQPPGHCVCWMVKSSHVSPLKTV